MLPLRLASRSSRSAAWVAAALAVGQTSPPKPLEPTRLVVGKPVHAKLTTSDPVQPGVGRCVSFQFTASGDGVYTVCAGSLAFDVMLLARDTKGVALPDLEDPADAGPGDSDRVTIPVQKGKTCVLLVAAPPDESGEFDLSVVQGPGESENETEAHAADLDFFQKALAFATGHQAPVRAARVGWQAADAAIHLGRVVPAEQLVAPATAAVEAAAKLLGAEELELLRVRLGIIAGVIAQTREDWKTAVTSFSAMQARCERALAAMDARKTPADDKGRMDFEAVRQVALAGQFQTGYVQHDYAAALIAARRLRESEASEAPAPGEPPTPIQCALLELLDLTGGYDEATKLAPDCAARLQRCIDPPTNVVLSYSRFLVGRARYAEAIDRLRAALGLAEAADDSTAIVDLAGELCAALAELGNHSEALDFARRMLAAARASGNEVAQGQAFLGLADAKLKLMNAAPARADAEEARRLFQKANATPRIAGVVITLATIDISEGKLDDATRHLDEVERLAVATGDAARPDAQVCIARIGLGYALLRKAIAAGSHDFAGAIACYEKALKGAEAIHDRRVAAIARGNLGDVARLQGDHPRTCELSRQAILELRALGRFEELNYPLLTIGQSALGVKDLALARAVLAEAEESLENPTAAGMLGGSAALLRVHLWEWGEIAQELTTLELAAARDDAKRAELIDAGCRLACRWKTRALLSGIADHARRREAGASRLADQLHEQLALQDRHSEALVSAFQDPGATGAIEPLQKELRDANARARKLEAELRAAVPPRVEDDVPTLAELRRDVVGPETVLVEFVNGVDHLYAYAIDAETVRRFDLGPRQELERAADAYLTLISNPEAPPPAAAVAKSGAELYQKLLAKALDGAPAKRRRLLVAPTTALGAVPFDALVTGADAPKGTQQRFSEIHYVLDRWIVSTLPSGAVACELARQKPRSGGGDWLLVGAPREAAAPPAAPNVAPNAAPAASDARSGLPEPEEGMSQEVLAIARSLAKGADEPSAVNELERNATGAVHGEAFELYLGEEATRAAVRGDLARFAVLHFACHGEFDPTDPRNTALRLAPSNGDTGRLSVLDVLDLELDANVTVLSACSTARGHRVDGDGEQSLARAFLVAGSRSVIATLWPVNDPSISTLMRRFFGSVGAAAAAPASNVDFAAELAQAKKEARRTGTRAAKPGAGGVSSTSGDDAPPPFWAGVVYFGVGPKR